MRFLFALLVFVAMASRAQAAPRYYGILMANDNLPRKTSAAGTTFVVPSGVKNVALGQSMIAFAPAKEKGLPLRFTANDVLRFERFLVRRADPSRITTLLPDWESRPTESANALGYTHRGPSTLSAAREAFTSTKCQIAAAKHRQVEGCDQSLGGNAKSRAASTTEHVVFVHFSGHGSKQGLFLRDGVLPAGEFADLVSSLDADLVVVTLDSCYGSGWDESKETPTLDRSRDVPDVVQGKQGIAVFKSANTLAEVAGLESGVLTHVVLSGLMGGADANGDDRISFAELSDFFYLHTSRSGQFDSRAESPGANQQRTLLDATVSGGLGELNLTLAAGLGGRLLVTDTQKRAVAEVNVRRPKLGWGRKVTLHLPAEVATDQFRLYFLPIDNRGKAGPVQVIPDWSLARSESQISKFSGEPADDVPARYLKESQARRGLFSEHAMPLNSRRLGRQVSVALQVGYQNTEAFGRIEDADIATVTNEGVTDTQASRKEQYIALQAEDEQVWNLVHTGVTARYHFANPFHLEARLGAEFSPNADVESESTGLLLGRGTVGVGAAGNLGSRSWIGWLSGGVGKVLVRTRPQGGEDILNTTPWTVYAGGGLVLRHALGGVTLDAMVYRDAVEVEANLAAVDGLQDYYSWSLILGVEVGRWSF